MKFNKIVIFLTCLAFISTAFNVNAQIKTCTYSESVSLEIKSCNYLEFVQEFTDHSFLLIVNASCLPSELDFTIDSRYNFSNFTINLGSPCERYIKINFEVYEIVNDSYELCDIDNKEGIGSSEILYDTYMGYWTGDDQLGDKSGYGHFNGCDDESFYEFERDFEICFSIDVIDPDSDGIPKWYEENVYHTNPLADDSERDDDEDNIPLYWEWKWQYDPFTYDNHKEIDPEQDGLNNYEEYLVSNWDSDPYHQDIFVELDHMETEPGIADFFVPEISRIMVYQTYAKRNIMFHIDDGCMGGGEVIPFDSLLWFGEERDYYKDHFLHNDQDNWRRGVFRYAIYVYDTFPIKGLEFPGENPIIKYYNPGLNSYIISIKAFKERSAFHHACIMLHELGHTLGIHICKPFGCDNQLMRFPWSLQRLLFKNYKSVMNYRYTYSILDYSDGSHGIGDYDDWGKIDLTYFQPDGAE